MILSKIVSASLYEFVEDPASPQPVPFEVFDGFFEKGRLVTIGSKTYRTNTKCYTKSLQNGYQQMTNNNPSLLHAFEYKNGLRVNYLRTDQYYVAFYIPFFPIIKFRGFIPFVYFDQPMISDLTQIVHKDSAGALNYPGGTHDYIEFVYSNANIAVKKYSNGTSPISPGALQSTQTYSHAAFAAAYPDYIFVRSSWSLISTYGGTYYGDHETVVGEISTVLYESSPTLDIDPRLDVSLTYTPASVLDGKNYTYHESWQEATYIVKADNTFDTVALTGLIAQQIHVTFYEKDGATIGPQIGDTQDIFVQLEADRRGLIHVDGITVIAYSPSTVGLTTPSDAGYVKIRVTGGAMIRVGGIHLGVAVDMGLTDLVFQTKFIDLSPISENFNVIEYKEGLKVREVSGSFSFWTTYYDYYDKLLLGMGQQLVIINGSDNLKNEWTDSRKFFAALNMVGRVKSMRMGTVKTDDRLGYRAKADFIIREQV